MKTENPPKLAPSSQIIQANNFKLRLKGYFYTICVVWLYSDDVS